MANNMYASIICGMAKLNAWQYQGINNVACGVSIIIMASIMASKIISIINEISSMTQNNNVNINQNQ